MSNKHFWIIFTIAAILRSIGIWQAPLWYDEAFSYLVARLPLDRLIAATAGDVHPPLHYLTVAPFALTGIPWLIRVPSVFFSLAALWCWWAIIKEQRFAPRLEWGAVLLMAFSPFQIYYAQEGRMYGLLIFLVLAAYLAMLRRAWVPLAIASAAMLYTQNYALFYLPALWLAGVVHYVGKDKYFLWSLWLHRKNVTRKVVLSVLASLWRLNGIGKLTISLAAAVLAYLPWFVVLTGQMGDVQRGYWITTPTAGSILYILFSMFGPFTVPQWAGMPVVVSLFSLLLFVPLKLQRPAWPVAIMAFVPLLLAIGMSFLWRPVLLFRGLSGSAPFLLWVVLLPLFNLRVRWQQVFAGALVIPFVVVGLGGLYLSQYNAKGGGLLEQVNTTIPAWSEVNHTADDSYIVSLANDLPQHNYRIQPCGHDNGGLSDQTRNAMGFKYADPANLQGWLFVSLVPLSNECSYNLAERLTAGRLPDVDMRNGDEKNYLMRGLYKLNK